MDGKRNPLKLSYRFISYLEKHRIYELFQELSMMLVIKKPYDHVLFLKQSIYSAFRRLDAPRIIILAPPGCDKLQVAGTLKEKLQVPLIKLTDVSDADSGISCIMQNLKLLLAHYMDSTIDGWIIIDFPRNEQEARYFLSCGIIPSHVIEIVSENTDSKGNHCEPNLDYQRDMRGMRRVFSELLKTVTVKDNAVEDITDKCLSLFERRIYARTPTTLRILILDFADEERCTCLGPHVAKEFNVLYIDFKRVLEEFSLHDTELGDKLREFKQHTCLSKISIDLKIEIFEKFLLQSPGLVHGWLLMGFVSTVEELKRLDLTDYPPNRILIIVPGGNQNKIIVKEPTTTDSSLSSNSCLSSATGTFISIPACKCTDDMQGIIDYAGKTAEIIEDKDDFEGLKEKIQSYLMQPPRCVPPRVPKPPRKISPDEIEFDPDDEPNPKTLDYIRNPEPLLPLI